jgi:hypothetical protein
MVPKNSTAANDSAVLTRRWGENAPTYGNGRAILKTCSQIGGAELIHRDDE